MMQLNLLPNQIFVDDAKCPICIEGLGEDPTANERFPCSLCNTDYHGTCLLSWTTNSSTCPACRAVEGDGCTFVAIKLVAPYATMQQMIKHILADGSLEQLLSLHDSIIGKIFYASEGSGGLVIKMKFLDFFHTK